MVLCSFFIGFDTRDGFVSFAAASANDRASGLLDSTSIIREDLCQESGSHARTSGRGRMAVDALSDLLKAVRLTGATFFAVAAREPWVAESPRRELILPKILPGADHLIAYPLVTMGRWFGNIVGEAPIAVHARHGTVLTNFDPLGTARRPGMPARHAG